MRWASLGWPSASRHAATVTTTSCNYKVQTAPDLEQTDLVDSARETLLLARSLDAFAVALSLPNVGRSCQRRPRSLSVRAAQWLARAPPGETEFVDEVVVNRHLTGVETTRFESIRGREHGGARLPLAAVSSRNEAFSARSHAPAYLEGFSDVSNARLGRNFFAPSHVFHTAQAAT